MSRYPKYEKYEKYDNEKSKGLYERLVTLFKNIKRVLKIANKPKRKDYLTTFKIVIIGLLILGGLSYVLQLIFQIIPL
jgi:protein transport protein SEC61 subunit gamma-like protein